VPCTRSSATLASSLHSNTSIRVERSSLRSLLTVLVRREVHMARRSDLVSRGPPCAMTADDDGSYQLSNTSTRESSACTWLLPVVSEVVEVFQHRVDGARIGV
jgi:hypothetical protein